MKRIIIKPYEQAADEKISIGGIKWLKKWDVCVQCDSLKEAEALKFRLAEKEQEPVARMRSEDPIKHGLDKFGTTLREKIMDDRTRLNALCAVMVDYLIPDGITAQEAVLKVIELLDPLPPKREWHGLTDEELYEALTAKCNDGSEPTFEEFKQDGDLLAMQAIARAVEAKLKEKNT